MAIIGKVEKKSLKVKILNLSIHLILLLGAATMVYPLLIMISGSIKSDVDFFSFSLLPEYVYDNELLYKKHLQTKYNGINALIFKDLRMQVGSVINIPVPENPSRQRYNDYRHFLTEQYETKPHYWYNLGMAQEEGVYPLILREFRRWLVRKYGPGQPGIQALNNACNTDYQSWDSVGLPLEYFQSIYTVTKYDTSILKEVLEFKKTQISGLHIFWTDLDGSYVAELRNLFGNKLADLNKKFGTDYNAWHEIDLATTYPADKPELAKFWNQYARRNIPSIFIRLNPAAEKDWQQYLVKRYNNDLLSFNLLNKTKYTAFANIPLPLQGPDEGQLKTDWTNFLTDTVKPEHIRVLTFADTYRTWLKKKFKTLDALNEMYQLGFNKFEEIKLPAVPPEDNITQAKDWQDFIKTINPENTGLNRTAVSEYRDFIARKYKKGIHIDFKKLSIAFKQEITSKHEIPFYAAYPVSPEVSIEVKKLYQEFINLPQSESIRVIVKPEIVARDWCKFLQKRYNNDISALNKAWGKVYTAWERIAPPTAEYEWFSVLDNRSMLIKEYLKRNYVMVFETIQTNGFAAKNTVIYCLLAVLASLLVNPLCAYGLSRYKMAPAYKILLFLMLPMAFPAMVLGIPQFLLIKNLGLLNTFAALILPGMANGYMIFLLKGFFDSLPKELFESAAIDGASEWTVFWHIAMGLSTPILSVLALNTFTAAYGNFMMAFLLCQDKSMWTMMVYLYQLQQRSSQAVGFAALIIAAIPTLLVFIFCQNIIIKGIVVPTEK